MVPAADFRLQAGQPSTYEKTAESGAKRHLVFCGDCGTHLYGAPPDTEAGVYSVRVGVLAQRAQLRPVAQIWCRSEVPWLEGLNGLHRIDTQ